MARILLYVFIVRFAATACQCRAETSDAMTSQVHLDFTVTQLTIVFFIFSFYDIFLIPQSIKIKHKKKMFGLCMPFISSKFKIFIYIYIKERVCLWCGVRSMSVVLKVCLLSIRSSNRIVYYYSIRFECNDCIR